MPVDAAAPAFEIVRAYVLVQLWGDAIVPSFGVETFEFHLLFRLRSSPGVTQAELGRLLVRDAMTVSRMVRSLEERGLVERRASMTDARARTVVLTRRGAAVVAKILAAIEREGPLRDWPRADVEQLVKLLRRAGDAFAAACARAGISPERHEPPKRGGARHGTTERDPERNRAARGRVVRPEPEEPLPRRAKRG